MTKCSDCGKETEQLLREGVSGFITGRIDGTKKTVRLCLSCFSKSWKLKANKKTNVFVKKET